MPGLFTSMRQAGPLGSGACPCAHPAAVDHRAKHWVGHPAGQGCPAERAVVGGQQQGGGGAAGEGEEGQRLLDAARPGDGLLQGRGPQRGGEPVWGAYRATRAQPSRASRPCRKGPTVRKCSLAACSRHCVRWTAGRVRHLASSALTEAGTAVVPAPLAHLIGFINHARQPSCGNHMAARIHARLQDQTEHQPGTRRDTQRDAGTRSNACDNLLCHIGHARGRQVLPAGRGRCPWCLPGAAPRRSPAPPGRWQRHSAPAAGKGSRGRRGWGGGAPLTWAKRLVGARLGSGGS